MQIEPIQRSSLYQEIVQQLEQQILSERVKPGERLPTERRLAELFGVSRTTIRQALAVLEAKGLIQSQIGSGTYSSDRSSRFAVAQLDFMIQNNLIELVEVMEVRAMLEPEVARLAALRGTAQQFAEIERHLEHSTEAPSKTLIQADEGFHHAISIAAQNSMVRTILNAITGSMARVRAYSLANRDGRATSHRDHVRIFEAIVAQRADEAADAMRIHIETIRDLCVQTMAESRLETNDSDATVGKP